MESRHAPLGLVVIGVHAPEFELARTSTTSIAEFVIMD
jgi:hypothetical protein